MIEALLTVFLVSVLLLSLLALVFSIVVSSASHRGAVEAGIRATAVAEAVDRLTYQRCGQATPVSYAAALSAAGTGFTARIDSIQYLQSAGIGVSEPVFSATCPTSGGDQGVQKIRVAVRMDVPPNVEEYVDLYKRDTSCPTNVPVSANQDC